MSNYYRGTVGMDVLQPIQKDFSRGIYTVRVEGEQDPSIPAELLSLFVRRFEEPLIPSFR